MAALAPALSSGLQRAIQNPGSLTEILGQLTGGAHQASFQNAANAHSETAVAGGSDILGSIFGSPNITGQIAQQASRVTGLRPDILAQMLPVIASIVAGGVASTLNKQGYGNILGQIGGNMGSSSPGGQAPQAPQGGLGGLLGNLLGGLFGAITGGQPASQGQGGTARQIALDALSKILQPGGQADPQHQAAISDILARR
ncbi:MAG: hypothetical protein NVS2B5_13980 [Beijerinckiaceae bacterium]